MKEATGELSMTVVVLLGIVFISTIVFALRKPISNYIEKQWKAMTGETIKIPG